MTDISLLEKERAELQALLDAAKSQADRNRLGQFATPPALATEMLELTKAESPKGRPIRFLDPGFGTGAFYSALLRVFPHSRVRSALGYELDHHYGKPAAELWSQTPLELRLQDFTSATPPATEREKANLIVCNPPYVRHHHLGATYKLQLKLATERASGVRLNGLAGLYCYFLCLSHAWMSKNALAVWLLPSEFMDVNYGRRVKEYLLDHVRLIRLHRFDPAEVQFGDALVSSSVVVFTNAEPPVEHDVAFTYGGSLKAPAITKPVSTRILRRKGKWTGLVFSRSTRSESKEKRRKLSEFFTIKRGIATGANHFFILSDEEASRMGLPSEALRPILPSPRYLLADEIKADGNGNPLTSPKLFLLDCRLPEDEIAAKHPAFWRYLEQGKSQGIHERYLCRHRSLWYAQEYRPAAPFLCTYMARRNSDGGAFRFILNLSDATAANVYLLLYPKPSLSGLIRRDTSLLRDIWQCLRDIPTESLLGVGRVYGGGLHKLEPKELAEAPADQLRSLLPVAHRARSSQLSLWTR